MGNVQCPYCAASIPAGFVHEIEHMQERHQDIIDERMVKAGFVKTTDGKWVDTLTDEFTGS